MVNLRLFQKEELGKVLIPEKIYKLNYKQELSNLYEKLYFRNLNYSVISNSFYISIILSLIIFIYIYPSLYENLSIYFGMFFWKIIILFSSWFILNLFSFYLLLLGYFFYKDSIFKRAEHEIEMNLPEFVDNMVSNLKGGIALEKAFLKSVRPEQKALLREVTLLNEKILMGKDVLVALKEMRERFESAILGRTLFLIEEGIRGGGNLAAPLERISENLKKIYALDEEIKGNSSGFAVVIRAITIFVAPLLFALAITLLTFIGNLLELLSKVETTILVAGGVPEEFSTYLVIFSYGMIFLITFFSSLITSQLKNEKLYEAVKYLPVYIIISFIIYAQASRLLLGFFGSII